MLKARFTISCNSFSLFVILSVLTTISAVPTTFSSCGNSGFPGSPEWNNYWECFQNSMQQSMSTMQSNIQTRPPPIPPVFIPDNRGEYNTGNANSNGNESPPPVMQCGTTGFPGSEEWNAYWYCFNAYMAELKEFCRRYGKIYSDGRCVYSSGTSNISTNIY